MPSPDYRLEIAGKINIHQGVHKAVIFDDALSLKFFENDLEIKQVSLSPDRASFSRTLERTQEKITLVCNRLGINEAQLYYDRSLPSKAEKLSYKFLIFLKLVYRMLIPMQWIIVYKKSHEKKWHKIIPDSKVFQADPFIVFKDNKYTVFYEELKFEDYHGYLMAAELDLENHRLINEKIILKLDYHLSFPNVFEENGIYYMIPEGADSHKVELYECTSFPYQWKKKKTLIDNIQAVDTTPLKTDNAWYLFTSEIIQGAGCDDELSIYKSTDLLNTPFEKLYNQPVISDVTNARMAGHFIQRDGEIFRVSQNCGKRYGYQTNVNKVLQIEGSYKEQLVETIKPSQGAFGFHTYNHEHEMIIADMEIARFDLYSLKRFVGGNFKRFFEIILGKDNSGKD
jgi:hypothetical protein